MLRRNPLTDRRGVVYWKLKPHMACFSRVLKCLSGAAFSTAKILLAVVFVGLALRVVRTIAYAEDALDLVLNLVLLPLSLLVFGALISRITALLDRHY